MGTRFIWYPVSLNTDFDIYKREVQLSSEINGIFQFVYCGLGIYLIVITCKFYVVDAFEHPILWIARIQGFSNLVWYGSASERRLRRDANDECFGGFTFFFNTLGFVLHLGDMRRVNFLSDIHLYLKTCAESIFLVIFICLYAVYFPQYS